MKKNTNKPQVQEDFYEAINFEWLKEIEIPNDKPVTGSFHDLITETNNQLIFDFEKMKKNELAIPENLKSCLDFYKLATNFSEREKLGTKPIQPFLSKIKNLTSITDWSSNILEFIEEGIPQPFHIALSPDMKNTDEYALYVLAPTLFLPEKGYYSEDNEAGLMLSTILRDVVKRSLALVGENKESIDELTEDALAFDRKLSPYMKNVSEASNYSEAYKPRSYSEFKSISNHIPFDCIIEGLINDSPDKIIVFDPMYFEAINELINPKNFKQMKAWMMVQMILLSTKCLNEEFRQTAGYFRRVLLGRKEEFSQLKEAYLLTEQLFPEAIGDYYGRTYFGEEAKYEATIMVQHIVDTFKNRLNNNTWLDQSTKDKAIKKLSNIIVKVGYPDEIDPVVEKLGTINKENIVSNITQLSKERQRYNFNLWKTPVNRQWWGVLNGSTVNACYEPLKNCIVFPAGVLQYPIYDRNQSDSFNYGAIGALAGHEITHAFDMNGSKFDEFGNLENWWTDKDKSQFNELSKKVLNQYKDIPYADGMVNAETTLSENISDAGGLSCALEAVKSRPSLSLEEFYTGWARMWRMKGTREFENFLLAIDNHSPNKIRVNMQAKNSDDFYQVFDIRPTDEMYMDPIERVTIW